MRYKNASIYSSSRSIIIKIRDVFDAHDLKRHIMAIYNNTLAENYTHFLCGVELVKQARTAAKLSSENWCYPVFHFGSTDNEYYAEVWVDGMDWQHNYYLLEADDCQSPLEPHAFMVFQDHNVEERLSAYDTRNLWRAVCMHRRGILMMKDDQYSFGHWPNDEVWPFLKRTGNPSENRLADFTYEHASQTLVEMKINVDLLPTKFRG
jgi:hypothetical protein